MEQNIFPLLFKIADGKSDSSQNNFLRINFLVFILLILSSLSSIFTSVNTVSHSFTVFCTICLIISTILNLYILFFRPEKSWYEGRAIAESVKTLTWKFVTGTKPFKIKLTNEKSQLLFEENLKKIIGQRKDFYVLIGKEYPNEKMISDEMISIRNSTFEIRKNIYLESRVQDQINWYSKKSKSSSKNKNITFSFIIGSQILGVIFFISELNSEPKYSFSSLSIALTTIFIAVLQLKKYQELTDSYGITSSELKFIKEKSKFIKNDDDLEKYVDDTENAISREHTLWLARRDNIELYN